MLTSPGVSGRSTHPFLKVGSQGVVREDMELDLLDAEKQC